MEDNWEAVGCPQPVFTHQLATGKSHLPWFPTQGQGAWLATAIVSPLKDILFVLHEFKTQFICESVQSLGLWQYIGNYWGGSSCRSSWCSGTSGTILVLRDFRVILDNLS